ncbi:23 kDa integral membrane protein [Dermatophagoides farinae]|uniref:Tetraspanin n=2 Tax=Dermatophagoides farinae TaxID=6954 RepID=A0A922I4R6_DERFA|nr:23 kDa integral membrane protein-like [Dermatophagoides farinae]KAH9522502.1 hypothetical protein DERF_006068 [Dermatophagoides farinae]
MGATHHENLVPLKMGVYATNFMLWSLGIVLMGICIWIRSDSALWAYGDNMDIYRYYQATYICLAISALILVMAFLGCLGAAHEFKYLMFFYCIMSGILIILEIAAAVLVWRIPGGDALQYHLGHEFKWHMEQRLYNTKSRQFLDLIQLKLECCGAETMLDYRKMYQDIPASCNSPRTNNINIRSCAEMLRRYLEKRGGAVGGIVCSLILVEFGSLLFSFLLLRQSEEYKNDMKQYGYR